MALELVCESISLSLSRGNLFVMFISYIVCSWWWEQRSAGCVWEVGTWRWSLVEERRKCRPVLTAMVLVPWLALLVKALVFNLDTLTEGTRLSLWIRSQLFFSFFVAHCIDTNTHLFFFWSGSSRMMTRYLCTWLRYEKTLLLPPSHSYSLCTILYFFVHQMCKKSWPCNSRRSTFTALEVATMSSRNLLALRER